MYAGLQAPPQLHDAVAVEADATDVRAHPIFNSAKSFLEATESEWVIFSNIGDGCLIYRVCELVT